MSLTELRLRAARARIAAACTPPAVDPQLGAVLLRPDQCAAAARVNDAIARSGGCLLADDVGRGKTYVALSVAKGWRRPLVVVPASLRATWRQAMERTGISCSVVSHEELSRGRVVDTVPDGIVVDESHHFRSTNTRRYGALADLAASARLLLLSATPLQNRTRDLAAQIALFHGARAFALDASALAAFVGRGGAAGADLLPAVAPPTWARPAVDDGAVLEAILSLPAPARPVDGGDPGVLRTIGLVRAWASSRAALRAAIRRRRRAATAIEASVTEGRLPARRELEAWQEIDGAIQLGFAPLLVAITADPLRVPDLMETISLEHDALRRLDAAMAATPDPDDARLAILREIRRAHDGTGVLAFAELATTAETYFRRLVHTGNVGLLTAREARIASGRLPRDALLERFAPRARGVQAPVGHELVTLLIATDLLSEGVNLQDASVVVHLDLPWNPARLAQRVGRVRRPGGSAVVHSYLVAPPAGAALLLDVERRLREKLGMAGRTLGRGIDVVPALASPPGVAATSDDGYATQHGETLQRIARWARPSPASCGGRRCRTLVAAAHSADAGWLAALDDGRLVACLNGAPPVTDVDIVARAARACEGPARGIAKTAAVVAIAQCAEWIHGEVLARECGQVRRSRRPERAIDRRVALAFERVPRHLRASAAARASRLLATASLARPLGAERALHRLLEDADAGARERWLDQAIVVAPAPPDGYRGRDRVPSVVAIICLGPGATHSTSSDGPPAE